MKILGRVLVDSNILVYAHNIDSPLNPGCLNFIKKVFKGEIKVVLSAQNLLEFYAIITDSKRVEIPLSPKEANSLLEQYLSSVIEIIYPTPKTLPILSYLLNKNPVKGAMIFDYYLVATMISNDVNTIVTANIKDFKQFSNIKILEISND